MRLTLNSSEFDHLPDVSAYNRNYYRNKTLDYIVREVCHEDNDYQEFYLVENGELVFIGSSTDGFGDGGEIKIDFKVRYT